MRKEDELIVSCACTQIASSLKGKVHALLNGDPDWNYIIQAASRHGVLPLLYHNLSRSFIDQIPADVLDKLRQHFRANIASNLIKTADLVKIVTLLEENGITVVPFKGPALAEYLYGDLGLRSFGDLDILIAEQDAEEAINLIAASGYKPILNLTSSQLEAYMEFEDDLVLINEKSGRVVELHWEMTGRYLSRPLDMLFVRDRLERVQLMDKDFFHLSPEHLLIYLCVHGTRHMWERLEWISSIAELVRSRKDLDWEMVFSYTGELRCRRILLQSLILVHDLFQIDLPTQVTERISFERTLQQVALQVKRSVFPLYSSIERRGYGNRFQLVQFKVRDSWRERISYAWWQLTKPRVADWEWLAVPGCMSFMYIFLRPLRLFCKLWGNVLRKKTAH